MQMVKFTTLLFVRSFHNTSGWKRMPLPFQMNIDKDLSDNGMELDDDVLYNFTDATSQLMRDVGITPWRGSQEKHPLFFQVLIDAFSKPEGIVADLTAPTCINSFFLTLFFYILAISTTMCHRLFSS